MVIELRVVQFWFKIKLAITNRTSATRSCDFESRVWFWTKLHSTQFNYHYKSTCGYHQYGTTLVSWVQSTFYYTLPVSNACSTHVDRFLPMTFLLVPYGGIPLTFDDGVVYCIKVFIIDITMFFYKNQLKISTNIKICFVELIPDSILV